MITLAFPIEPYPKGRPRMGKFGCYTPKKTRLFENGLRAYARGLYKGAPLLGPLAIVMVFCLTRPKSVKRKYPSVKPDLDNLQKALLDSCNGILWEDDAQIVESFTRKRYETNSSHGWIHLMVFSKEDDLASPQEVMRFFRLGE